MISTFGRPGSLQQTLDSLRTQSMPPEEVLVAVWEGDHATADALAGQTQARVIPVLQNTIAAKENAGIAAAGGDVVAFIDDDAVARPDWLERVRGHYIDESVVGVGGRDLVHHGGVLDDRPAPVVGRIRWFGRVASNHHLRTEGTREVHFLKGCNMSFRRSVIRPIDSRLQGAVPYAFEIDMGLSARRWGRILYDPDACVDHFPSSDMNANNAALASLLNHNQTYVLLKHLGWPNRICFLAYTFLVGDRDTIGLFRVPLLAGRPGWSRSVLAAHFQGKLAGLLTFGAWLFS